MANLRHREEPAFATHRPLPGGFDHRRRDVRRQLGTMCEAAESAETSHPNSKITAASGAAAAAGSDTTSLESNEQTKPINIALDVKASPPLPLPSPPPLRPR
ncbi:hypothetical protein C8R44DRAFT_888116 [Mycena epipterygia]|nr:hypothetical protein C8R44DRAFT_888116 [Mycena epipterygia]